MYWEGLYKIVRWVKFLVDVFNIVGLLILIFLIVFVRVIFGWEIVCLNGYKLMIIKLIGWILLVFNFLIFWGKFFFVKIFLWMWGCNVLILFFKIFGNFV